MAEPKITHRAVHDSGGGNLPVRRIVIHATCPGKVPYPAASARGTASGTARYFQDRDSGGSAHYIYDAAGGAEHCVPDATIAWHAPPNSHSIGIEICGQSFYTREQWLSPAVWPAVAAAAARTRELCSRHGVPVRRLSVADLKAGKGGICGHVDVSNAFRQTDHSDPGSHFPWDAFMTAVRGDKPPMTEESDILKTLVDLGATAAQTIPAGQRRSLVFETEYLDPEKIHTDTSKGTRYPSIFPKGGDAPYSVMAQVELESRPQEGVVLSIASYERDADKLDRDVRERELVSRKDVLAAIVRMSDRSKYRVDIVNGSNVAVVVKRAYLLIAH